jgi:hypothetical protein
MNDGPPLATILTRSGVSPVGVPPPATTSGSTAIPSSTRWVPADDGWDVAGARADLRAPATMDAAFEHLLGRQATDAERLRLRQLREMLGIGSNDAVWLIFVALDYYVTLYQQVPEALRGAAKAILVEYKEKADATLAEAAQGLTEQAQHLQDALKVEATQAATEVQQQLTSAIAQAAHRIAVKALRGPRWPWLLGGAVTMALALGVVAGIALGYGRHQGYAQGYTEGYTLGLHPTSTSTPPPSRPPPHGR